MLWSVAFWISSLPSAVALDHDDALDLDGSPVLDLLQRLVGLPGGLGVAKSATISV